MKERKQSFISKLKMIVPAILLMSATTAMRASANVKGSMTNAGITGAGNTAGLFDDLKNIVYLIMGVGGIWCVAFLVIGGMLLGGSAGNPQKRGSGIAALGSACIGLFVIYKAYDIAGWATGIGS